VRNKLNVGNGSNPRKFVRFDIDGMEIGEEGRSQSVSASGVGPEGEELVSAMRQNPELRRCNIITRIRVGLPF